jgi:hypothetical protein
VSTPVTLSPNVTVQLTLDALVGLAAARLIEETLGGPSTTTALLIVNVALAPVPHALLEYVMK